MAMQSVTVRAPAKINLALAVGARGSDGYHPLTTVYQAVDLCDEIRAGPADDEAITLTVTYDGRAVTETAQIPLGEQNLAYRAAALLRERSGADSGVTM